ncbi:HAD-IA family hydrolase [Catenulispora rubra]|uniref:HAD-IA family hydrolase n=1 Tax=Catenulispora rubra TaxID=280293 RepID=UPI002B274EB9|nr:HAD-IA family hydrolase [Catenulispora rubra]
MAHQGLIMDFGGVMTTPMHLNSRAFEQEHGLAVGSYTRALSEHPDGVRVYADVEIGRATQAEWNAVIGTILGVDPTDLMRRALANLRPEPDMVAYVAAARAAGVVTALLSNSFGGPYDVYADLGLLGLFDVVVLSDQAGVRKPDPAIYDMTLQRMGVAGPQAVFVDDVADNLLPAEALGITTIHYTSSEAAIESLNRLFTQVRSRP